ncbi:MAG: DEAD/DEAH box helicase family protein [Acidimicrobiia bacterium]|nr:DEAD/DEAH box helicase family protein [Acidimicrobiia bacterium]
MPIRPYAVCSDVTAGKTLEGENATPHDLVVPPTTDPAALVEAKAHELPADAMTVVFSTYQSIEVVAAMQVKTGLVFDLVVCDEAHRTAGVSSVGDKDSAFGLVHDNDVIPAAKRLYMTATPRLFKPLAADAAKEADAVLASMDDEALYGPEFHRLGFGEAVEQGLLADYRVLILTVAEQAVSESFQHLLSTDGALSLPDVARFVGCLSGLAKLPGATGAGFDGGEPPMQRRRVLVDHRRLGAVRHPVRPGCRGLLRPPRGRTRRRRRDPWRYPPATSTAPPRSAAAAPTSAGSRSNHPKANAGCSPTPAASPKVSTSPRSTP